MRTLTVLTLAGALLAACDTGDGTELRPPAPDAPPATDVPIGTVESSAADPAGDQAAGAADGDSLATAPIPTEVSGLDPNAPTLPTLAETGVFELAAPWADGEEIDVRYGCDGLNASPPLAWAGVPPDAVELAVALENRSDVSRGQPFVHWVMTGLDPTTNRLVENEVPLTARDALNFFGNVGYDGPCPDPDSTDVYVVTLYALAAPIELPEGTPAAQVLDAIRSVVVDQTVVTGSRTR